MKTSYHLCHKRDSLSSEHRLPCSASPAQCKQFCIYFWIQQPELGRPSDDKIAGSFWGECIIFHQEKIVKCQSPSQGVDRSDTVSEALVVGIHLGWIMDCNLNTYFIKRCATLQQRWPSFSWMVLQRQKDRAEFKAGFICWASDYASQAYGRRDPCSDYRESGGIPYIQ